MNASGQERCQRCGAVIPADSAERICPACLLSGALTSGGAETGTVMMTPGRALSLDGPSSFPCAFGGYRLLGLLGRGGMGAVYEAQQLATGRRVALKMLGPRLDSPDMRQRFLREGRLAARVNHPNSLYVFGSEEIEGLPVITMEVAGGGTLKDEVKKRGALPVAEAVDAILDVIAGLEAALAAGVLHRDVKPSNCFVCPDGSVKVGDFGLSVSTLAKVDTFVTAHGRIMGTPAYASPEQLRGDTVDVRADIYSVGATLFTLLTDRAPFEGENAVQVVANAVNQEPAPLTGLRRDVPPGLERAVARCLAKEPDGRYADYAALRNALLPFSSREPEPASMLARVAAGWIDYLLAFLPPYVALMFLVGGEQLLVRPLVERTLGSARYYFLLLGIGFLYFVITEGVWGAGLGKWLKGLQVVRAGGRRPGLGRAVLRILIPIGSVEVVRMPLMMTFISEAEWTGLQTAGYVVGAVICGWIPGLLALRARRENGFATAWDLASGTRVVIRPKGTVRPRVEPAARREVSSEAAGWLGPYQIESEIVPGQWIAGTDPVLRRQVWLLRRSSTEPSGARRKVARSGRLRWLQKVEADGATWDAFEATPGAPFSALAEGRKLPWGRLRHWLHDLASEMWDATRDQTLPAELSLDQVWITADGRAILLDEPWPEARSPAERVAVGDVAGQQRFLNAVAARVEPTGLPLPARPVLRNLSDGKFEKLSFLTGTLRGLLPRPAEVSRGIRAGSIFMLPFYVWVAAIVGRYHDKPWDDPVGIVIFSALAVLGAVALADLLGIPFRGTASHAIFRLAVINARGELAAPTQLLARWAIVWLPLLGPLSLAAWLLPRAGGIAAFLGLGALLLWVGAAVCAVVDPHRGGHHRLAGTWVVRR
jgi:tRNA A-37 threonylcarbamoyl transferase component Bud32